MNKKPNFLSKNLKLYFIFVLYNIFYFFIIRLLFFIIYKNHFSNTPLIEIAQSFLWGIRFDLSSIAVLSSCPFLLFIIPGKWKENKHFQKINWLFLWILFIINYSILFSDLFYYKYVLRRLSFEIFTLHLQMSSVISMILLKYWYALFVFFTFLLIYFKTFSRILLIFKKATENQHDNILSESFSLFLFIIFTTVAIRGGIQMRPMNPSFAFIKDNIYLGHLTLNATYTVSHMLVREKVAKPAVMLDKDSVERLRNLLKDPNEVFINDDYPLLRKRRYIMPTRKLNVVIFILEGWTAKYTYALGRISGVTPFFDTLVKKGLLFTNFYAAGTRTLQSLPAILCSLPPVFDFAIDSSTIEQNRIRSIAHILKENGYKTIFLHGEKKDSFNLNAFCTITGFEKHIAFQDFGSHGIKIDRAWGVHDEHVFIRAHEEFKNLEEPFLGVVFSLSSHPPFDIPEGFNFFKDETTLSKFFNSLRYTDWSLERFFNEAKKSKYYKNTLFIILGDHTTPLNLYTVIDAFRVPCLFFIPNDKKLLGKSNVVGNQVDILPTILDILKINTVHSSFGKSLLNNDINKTSFMFANETMHWIKSKYLLTHNREKTISLHDYISDTDGRFNLLNTKEELANQLSKELLSFYNVGRSLIMENKIYPSQDWLKNTNNKL